MIAETLICDHCGAKVAQGDRQIVSQHRLWLTVDRGLDAAGSMDSEQNSLDLCGLCAVKLLQKIVKDWPMDQQRALAQTRKGERGG